MPVYTLKAGTKPPDEVNVVVEIPKGSSIKYEIDPKNGRTSVDRILFPECFIPITMVLFLKQKTNNPVVMVKQIQLMYL